MLPRGAATGAARVGTGGRVPGLSEPAVVETAGRDDVLPDMEWAAAIEANVGRAGTGGGMFRLAGIGGASLPGVIGELVGTVTEARPAAWLSINPAQCSNNKRTGLSNEKTICSYPGTVNQLPSTSTVHTRQ